MICPNCNKNNNDNVRFCSNCGFEIASYSNSSLKTDSNVKTAEELESINKTAKTLTIISLCLRAFDIFIIIIALIFFMLFDNLKNLILSSPMVLTIGFAAVCCISSIILIIIAQVKVAKNNIKNKFVKTVFITQIILLIINFTLVGCLWAFSSAHVCIHELGCDDLSGCG